MKDNFKKQLKKLKEKGIDINPEQVFADVNKPFKKKEIEFDEEHWQLLKMKMESILGDYYDHYRKKGCGLRVFFYIDKENSADTYTESFPYNKKLQVATSIEIGTKGKYEPVDCIGESVQG